MNKIQKKIKNKKNNKYPVMIPFPNLETID